MRTVSRITVAMSVIVMSLTSVGHTCAETNNLIRSMRILAPRQTI